MRLLRLSRFPRISRYCALFFLLAQSTQLHALEVPPLRGRVNDLAGLMPPGRAQALEERLKRFEDETGIQIAVLTIPSLKGEDLEGFSIKVAETWKIGRKGFDTGVILLIARDDRKLRIEVGYGLEGVLPDALASRIIREIIVPRFRENDYPGGIESGLEAIMKATRGEAIPKGVGARSRDPDLPLVAGLLFMAALLALIVGFTQRTALRGALAGGIGAALITLPGALRSGPGTWIAILLTGAIIGALANLYAHQVWGKPWTVRRSSRREWRPGDLLSGSDSFYGGSGWGGFDGGFGGGFGGGGGGFGGGGASGSW